MARNSPWVAFYTRAEIAAYFGDVNRGAGRAVGSVGADFRAGTRVLDELRWDVGAEKGIADVFTRWCGHVSGLDGIELAGL